MVEEVQRYSKMPLKIEKFGSTLPYFFDRAMLWTSNMLYEDSYIHILDADWVEGTDTPVVKDGSATGSGFNSPVLKGADTHRNLELQYLPSRRHAIRHIPHNVRYVSHPCHHTYSLGPRVLADWKKYLRWKTHYPPTLTFRLRLYCWSRARNRPCVTKSIPVEAGNILCYTVI